MAGLVVPDKAERVYNFHHKTVENALEITGALGHDSPAKIKPSDVLRRDGVKGLRTLEEIYPHVTVHSGALLHGEAPKGLQRAWDMKDGYVHSSYVS